jgi:hypothetical protein
VAASDADNDPLSYAWTSTCTGSFSASTATSPTFTLAAGQSGACTLSVVVSDGRGGSTSGALTLPIGQPAVLAPPVIVDFVQSMTSAFSGQTVNLLVDATDPQGSALTFQWSANGGTLAGQQDAATSSSVVWTAPDTCTGGWQIKVTVTDAQSLVTTQVFTVNCASACSQLPGHQQQHLRSDRGRGRLAGSREQVGKLGHRDGQRHYRQQLCHRLEQ